MSYELRKRVGGFLVPVQVTPELLEDADAQHLVVRARVSGFIMDRPLSYSDLESFSSLPHEPLIYENERGILVERSFTEAVLDEIGFSTEVLLTAGLVTDADATLVPAITQEDALWTPEALGANLKLWLKGDDFEAAGGPGGVALWPDSSGEGNDATSIAGGSPTLESAALNGYDTVKSVDVPDAADKNRMVFPDFMSAFTAGTMYAVAKNVAGIANGGPLMNASADVGQNDVWPFTANNEIYCGWGSTARKSVGDPGDMNNWYLAAVTSATSEWKLYWNDVQFFTTGTNTVGWPAVPGLFRITGDSFPGQLAEIVVTNTVLSTNDRQKLAGYYAHKFALTALLAGDHPYKTDPPTL